MASEKSESEFLKWFSNPEQKKAREKAMEMSGIPLEIKAKRLLSQLGYRASRAYYEAEGGTSRELDFLANRKLDECALPGGQVVFYLDLLGECKRSSTHDFFAFEAEQVEDTLVLSTFPLGFYREKVTTPPFSSTLGSLKHHYSFPFVTDRIVEVDADHYPTRERDNYGDKVTHTACEALLMACGHFKEANQKLYDYERRRIFSPLQVDYAETTKKMPGATPRQLVKELLQNSGSAWDDFSYFPITFGVPLLVLDDNRGLISTILGKDGSVEFKGDMGFVLHPYVSENIQQFERAGAMASFPVVICKYASLSDTVKVIETGTRKVIQQFMTFLKGRPEALFEEVLVTEIELQRKASIF